MDENTQMEINRDPLPRQFSDAAFQTQSGEMGWAPNVAADVVEWLSRNGYGLLGAELWVIRPNGEICTLFTDAEGRPACWAVSVNRNQDEPWAAFVGRAATNVRSNIAKVNESDVKTPGQVFINLTYVTESEFNSLPDSAIL